MTEQSPALTAANDQLDAELMDIAAQLARYDRKLLGEGVASEQRTALLTELQCWLLSDDDE